MIRIALDTGNKQIKTENFCFTSGMTEQAAVPNILKEDEYFKCNGKYRVLINKRQDYMRDKTTSDRYFYLTLMGVVKELDLMSDKGEIVYDKNKVYDIHLLLGLPPAHMKDTSLRKRYANYFKNQREEKILYKGKVWNICIKKISVFSQCFAAMMTVYNDIKSFPRVIGIDVGGFTADYIIMRNGKPDIETIDSLESGVIILYQRIKRACLVKDVIVEEEDIDNVLLGKDKDIEYTVKKIIDEETKKFIDSFLALFREYQIDLKNYVCVFTGGGSLLLKKYIEQSTLIKKCVFINDIKANAKGYKILSDITGGGK